MDSMTKSVNVPLAETCQIGLQRIAWATHPQRKASPPTLAQQLYPDTVDPAPAFDACDGPAHSADTLRAILINPKESLFKRYQALFTLRDLVLEAGCKSGDAQKQKEVDRLSVLLADGLAAPGSAMLRHEVAFVLGQITVSATIPKLISCLESPTEHPIVRHEAAEALGSVIGSIEAESGRSTADAELARLARDALKLGVGDSEQLVRESCVLALDIADYVASPLEQQYCNVPTSGAQ